jgi:hypothetical protein
MVCVLATFLVMWVAWGWVGVSILIRVSAWWAVDSLTAVGALGTGTGTTNVKSTNILIYTVCGWEMMFLWVFGAERNRTSMIILLVLLVQILRSCRGKAERWWFSCCCYWLAHRLLLLLQSYYRMSCRCVLLGVVVRLVMSLLVGVADCCCYYQATGHIKTDLAVA